MVIMEDWFDLFSGISTPYGLFNAKIWFIYKHLVIIIFSTLDESLKGTSTPGLIWPGSNINEGVLYTPQSSRTGVSLPDVV